jgi:alpha-L-fucosidase 2
MKNSTNHQWSRVAATPLLALPFILLAFGCQEPGAIQSEPESVTSDVKTYELWEPAPAPNRGHEFGVKALGRGYPYDEDWERWSYPLGNGMLGANVFGRTDVERIQLTEKTILNGSAYGRGAVTNAGEIYLDIGHESISNYRRALNLNDAIKTVSYESGGVRYAREYFTSYPDDLMVVRLTADQAGALSFTLRPEIPYLEAKHELDTKSGTVTAKDDTITLAGTIDYYQVNYEIQIKVLPEGGTLNTGSSTIVIEDADAVTLLIAVDTNYELGPHIFLNEPKEKLDPELYPHDLVTAKIENATDLGYAALRERHLADYRGLFGRVAVNLNSDVSELPTHELLAAYRAGEQDNYLEELIFQYGRYLLIASSRENTLPAHLQGAWSQYEVSPWCAGYWHNINVQMNYWGAFNANLAETFQAYLNYFEAYKPKAQTFARDYIAESRPEMLSEDPAENGWILGTGANAYQISGRSTHSGPGTGGFTAQLFMDYYNFTQDEEFLRETGYPALLEMSRFLAKTLHETEDGLLLVEPSASPEIREDGEYYVTRGCTYDQGFVWENHTSVLHAAEVLGKEDPFLREIEAQIPRLDPILIGSSGQIKEFREEDAYGEIGDPHHRHTSQLCPLYPGTLIDEEHPEWMKAASVTLDLRGKPGNGWATAHRLNLRARLHEAEAAHDLLELFIDEKAANNLWSIHPPFQIDGNFGIMSGVAEMLLQSHTGAIEPLPALPKAWATGSYEGLVARGNFEIGAEWAESRLTGLRIHSRSGKDCRLKHPDLAGAEVVDANGDPVAFTTNADEGELAFATEKGMHYSIVF